VTSNPPGPEPHTRHPALTSGNPLRTQAITDFAGGLPFDVSRAHQARVYDFLLGGKDNYAADRAFAEELVKVWPGVAVSARVSCSAFSGQANCG
jgi:hypothetical protein